MPGWDESKHKRGQPQNAGQFGPGGASKKTEDGGIDDAPDDYVEGRDRPDDHDADPPVEPMPHEPAWSALPHGHRVAERLKPKTVTPEQWETLPTKFKPDDWDPQNVLNAAAVASGKAHGATVNVWHGPKGWVASAQPAPKDAAMGRYYQVSTMGNTVHGRIVEMADAAHFKFFRGPGGD